MRQCLQRDCCARGARQPVARAGGQSVFGTRVYPSPVGGGRLSAADAESDSTRQVGAQELAITARCYVSTAGAGLGCLVHQALPGHHKGVTVCLRRSVPLCGRHLEQRCRAGKRPSKVSTIPSQQSAKVLVGGASPYPHNTHTHTTPFHHVPVDSAGMSCSSPLQQPHTSRAVLEVEVVAIAAIEQHQQQQS